MFECFCICSLRQLQKRPYTVALTTLQPTRSVEQSLCLRACAVNQLFGHKVMVSGALYNHLQLSFT